MRRALAITFLISAASTSASAAPTEPNELTNPLVVPANCRGCHEYNNATAQAADPPYAPYKGWRGSLMAHASRDPAFWAAVALASQDAPGETEACIRCHTPRAFLEGRGDAITMGELYEDDLESIECEFCHRMMDEGIIGNGQYTIDDVVAGMGTVARRGPWTYPSDEPPHAWLQEPFLGSSEACGVCHDVTTPAERVDDAGIGLGVSFNEQRTYSEWENSAFAVPGAGFRSCQDCHMPAVSDMPGCLQKVNQSSHPTGGRRHDLSGPNGFMLELLKDLYGDAGTGDVDDVYYEIALERANELLATAATLDVPDPGGVDLDVGLALEVTVSNETGHKLPSGYSEGRVMWLEVVASYAGTQVWTSGLWQPGVGPEQDGQLRTYRGLADQYSTGITSHLLLNDHWVEDTRIPPRGLVSDPETDPVGDRYTLQNDDTWPHFDQASYAFAAAPTVQDVTPADPNDDELEIRVRLMYLVNTPEYIDQLADDNETNSAGADLQALFVAKGGATPVVLAEQTVVVPIVGFGSGGGTGTTSGGTGTTSSQTGSGTSTQGTTGTGTSDAGSSSDAGTSETSGDGGTTATETGEGTDASTTTGCGCTAEPRALFSLVLLFLPWLVGRRRRRT